MTYIYLDPVGLQSFIDGLRGYADAVGEEREAVRRSVVAENDPSDIESSLTWGSPLAQRCYDLFGVANELQTRLDEAIAMNESGITPMSADGRLSYYLPDEGEGSEDTVENVQAFNSASMARAAADAEALAQATNSRKHTADDGRTVEEILADMARYQDAPAYCAAFVKVYGVDNMIDVPLGLQWHYTSYDTIGGSGTPSADRMSMSTDRDALDYAVGVLGTVLGTATQTENYPSGYSSWSEAIYEAVTEDGHRGRMSSMNALLAVPGSIYGTQTLIDLAGRLEDLEFDGAGSSKTRDYAQDQGRALKGESMDPLYGVMTAMGNNPDAALGYLTEGGGGVTGSGLWEPSAQTQERWELLTERSWDADVGLDAFTAAQAAASAGRGDEDAGVAGAASWVAARSIEFAVVDVESQDYTEAMKENLSVVVANCAGEAVSVAGGGSAPGLMISDNEAEEASLMTSLIYRIIDNENAAGTVVAAMSEHVVRTYDNISTPNDLNLKYNQLGQVLGYVNAIGNERVADLEAADAEEAKRVQETMGTVLSVATTLVGTGISGTVGSAAWSVGTTVLTPVVLDQLVPDGAGGYEDPVGQGSHTLESLAYVEAASRGLVDGQGVYDPTNLQDDRGVLYGWVEEEGGVLRLALPEAPTPEQNVQVHDWRNRLAAADPDDREVVDDVDRAIGGGVGRGVERVSGTDGPGGEDGDIVIKK